MTKWTPELAARARELLDKATPRPWVADLDVWDEEIEACVSTEGNKIQMLFTAGTDLKPDFPNNTNWLLAKESQEFADAALIAAAPDLLEAAMAEIERLRGALRAVRECAAPIYTIKGKLALDIINRALREDGAE